MCPHCCNTAVGGCIHCRPDQNESAREHFQIAHGRPSATRVAIGVITGRLFSPPELIAAAERRERAEARRTARREREAARYDAAMPGGTPSFGCSVLPAGFAL